MNKPLARAAIVPLSSVLLSAAGMLFVASCTTTRLPRAAADPDDPIRFHTWEDYYERGRRRILAGDVQRAREDFEVCVGLRQGARRKNDRDDWRVRTHGMHMFNGYFPNRELGICHYRQGDLDRAQFYLERSTSQTPSSRAVFFINRIEAQRLVGARPAPPRIELAAAGPVWTDASTYRVAGRATGPGKIARVAVGGTPVFVELADDSVSFSETVDLVPGANHIRVEAEDLGGERVEASLEVIADWEGPQFAIQGLEKGSNGWTVRGECADNGELRTLVFNGKPIRIRDRARRAPLLVTALRGEPALLRAEDRAGNKLEIDLASRLEAEAPGGAAPEIEVSQDRAVTVVHEDRYYLDGEVVSSAGLEHLTLNGDELIHPDLESRTRIRFSRFCPVQPGTNVLELVAVDARGAQATKALTVVRTAPDYVRKEYRLGASVPPIYASHNPAVGRAWQARIMEALVGNGPPRFNLLTTDPDDLAAICRELDLQSIDLVDPRARIDYRKFNTADLSFNGLLVQHDEGVEIRVHLVDTQDGMRHGYADMYIDSQDPAPQVRVQALVDKIERHYPVLTGNVVRLAGNRAALNIGEDSGLTGWARFLVIEPGSDGSLRRGSIRAQGDQWLELQVVDLDARSAMGALRPRGTARFVEKGDYVYAR